MSQNEIVEGRVIRFLQVNFFNFLNYKKSYNLYYVKLNMF